MGRVRRGMAGGHQREPVQQLLGELRVALEGPLDEVFLVGPGEVIEQDAVGPVGLSSCDEARCRDEQRAASRAVGFGAQ